MSKTLLSSLIFLFSLPAIAYEYESSGSLQLNAGQIFSPDTKEMTYQTFSIEPEYRSQMKLNEDFRFNFDAWGNFDPLNKSDTDVTQLELNEFTLAYLSGGRRIKIGYSFRNWEGTDLINPMDIFYAKNWIDPLNSRTRSGLGLFYDDSFGNFEVDFTYIARQKRHLLPGDQSQWWPRSLYLPTESKSMVLLLDDQLTYHIHSPEILDHALDNNLALRIQYHGSNFDIALAATEGLTTPPLLSPIINVTPIEVSPRQVYRLQSPVQIVPIFYRQRAVAGNLVWTLGDYILRASANHVQPLGNDERLPSWSQLGVVGIERTFYWKNQMFTLLGQYIDSKRPDITGVSLLTSLYQKSYMVGFRWAPNDRWTSLIALFQETTTWSRFLRGQIDWGFKDNWNLSAEVNIFEGPASSAIGTYDRNDSGYLHLKRSF